MSTPGAVPDRTYSAPPLGVQLPAEGTDQRSHGVHSASSKGRTDCGTPRDLGNPDASLSALGGRATPVAGRRDHVLLGACVDSAPRLGGATPGAVPARTHSRSRGCRGHTAGRSVPVPRSTGSCRAGSSARDRPPNAPSPSTGQRGGKRGIKSPHIPFPKALRNEGPGSDFTSNPGLHFLLACLLAA